MQRKLAKELRSDEELIKDGGLILDYDEIARKGSMTREESAISKWYGIYGSRQAGDHMARVVVPGGVLTSVQARDLARISKKYSPNLISITTRQAVQLHKIQLQDLPHFLRDIHAAGMTTFHGCGDVTRNVAACPWASVCPHRRVDVLPYAQETAKLLADSRDLDNLPRKFKITFSGCQGSCGQPNINCIGAIAVKRTGADGQEETGFQVNIGGGLGWKPFIAQELYSFVPKESIAPLSRAIGILFRDHGDRHIRMYARLKFVVHRKGIDECRRLLEGIMDEEGIDYSRFETAEVIDIMPDPPFRPLREDRPLDDNGLAIQRIKIPKGEMSSDALHRISELAEIYGDKQIIATNRQNLEIHGVQPERIDALRKEIVAIGLDADDFFGLTDVVTCVGKKYCPLAVTHTHDLFDAMQDMIREPQYLPIRDKVIVNISGCPNSCSQYNTADIGFRGLRVREETGSVEGYRIVIGGDEREFATDLADFVKFEDCLKVLRVVLDTFLATNPQETLYEQVKREGIARYQQAIRTLNLQYQQAVNPLETSVHTGEGKTPLDMKTFLRDIPCQSACPAQTSVPDYIRHIAEGNPEAAHRINQEDNVFPNTLGRVCTRPCEDACRYQWTSTRKAVHICHLKRAAADRVKSEPLPPWFEPSGKKVAIIGSGPAGLSTARELKRYGHEVTIFERAHKPGGQMRAIPAFRLPDNEVEEDINAILDSGIELKLNETVDHDRLCAMLEEYDALLAATGTNHPITIPLKGLPDGVALEGLHFMMQYNEGEAPEIHGDVIIIGGGFTAVDCARSARRLAPEAKITIMYRRGEAQMAANEEEFQAMREEGIHIETLVTPIAATMDGDRLHHVSFERNLLGEVDESGKPRFIPIEGSKFSAECGTLIMAIGQKQETEILGEKISFVTDENVTNHERLFVAGDFSSGSGDVISSAADGKAAADAMDEFLMGEVRRRTYVHIEETGLTGRTRDHDLIYPQPMPMLPIDQRGGDKEVELGYEDVGMDEHAWRCYLCNHKFEIDQDKCIHCDWCIRVSPRDCIKRLSTLERDADGAPVSWEEVPKDQPEKATYIWIDSDNCIRCGNCINICPTNAISLRKLTKKTCNCK